MHVTSYWTIYGAYIIIKGQSTHMGINCFELYVALKWKNFFYYGKALPETGKIGGCFGLVLSNTVLLVSYTHGESLSRVLES